MLKNLNACEEVAVNDVFHLKNHPEALFTISNDDDLNFFRIDTHEIYSFYEVNDLFEFYKSDEDEDYLGVEVVGKLSVIYYS